MNDIDLLHSVLELKSPWRVLKVRDDLRYRQIDIWVGTEPPKKGWIFGRKASDEQASEHVWRHANLGACRCVIHATIPATAAIADFPWCGEKDTPFTRTLSRQVTALLSNRVPLRHICALLDVAVEDLLKLRQRLDMVEAGLVSDGGTAGSLVGESSPLPGPDDPIWENMISGAVNIDIRVLSLKLFLAKLREQTQFVTDREVKTIKCHELQRYFARNAKYLSQELAQLRMH